MFALVHHREYVAPLPAGNSFPMSKYGLLIPALAELGVEYELHMPAPMPRRAIEAVHDPVYVAAVFDGALTPEQTRRIGFPVTPEVVARSRRVMGGTYLAARLALSQGFAVNSAGGSHHALADAGAGYCVFNDLAVAAQRLLSESHVERLMIVDLDVHQGDGSAAILAARTDAITFSMHAAKNFPVRKTRSTRDVELPDGTEDSEYLAVLANELPPLLDHYRPQLVLYQSGVDPHVDDRLGRLALSDAGLAARDHFVVRACTDRDVPIATTLGGGYGNDVGAVAMRHARSIKAAADAFGLVAA